MQKYQFSDTSSTPVDPYFGKKNSKPYCASKYTVW